MNFSTLLLGVIFILLIFDVGESVYKKLNLPKWILMGFVGLLLVFKFVPDLNISGVYFSFSGFILPLILSVFIAFNIIKLKSWFYVFVGTLVTLALTLIYDVADFNAYEISFFQPYIALGVVLGIILFITTKDVKNCFLCLFLGNILAEIIFFKSRFEIYTYQNLTLGAEMFLCLLVVGFVTSLFSCFIYRKILAKQKSKKRKREKILLQTEIKNG